MFNVINHQENVNLEGLKLKQLISPRIGEDVEKLGPSYTASRNAKWQNHFRKLFGHFLRG